MRSSEARVMAVVAAAVALGFSGIGARAQERAPAGKSEAVLIVDGVVREVFRSPRQDRVDYLVQIDVKRSELGRTPAEPVRLLFPAPGDVVYVHTSEPAGQRQSLADGRDPAADGARTVPAERSQVRAYLVPRARGGWEGTHPTWFELSANLPVERTPADPPPVAAEPAPAPTPRPTEPASGAKSALTVLGLTAEERSIQGRFVLRVTSVERGGPAQKAGLEVGDVMVAANDKELGNLDQFGTLARAGGTLNLIVLDINTGKAARITVDLGNVAAAETPRRVPDAVSFDPPANPAGGRKTLGISAETVSLGQRTAMKITGVEKGSPAEKAGIEPGDILVAVNGAPITGAEALGSAVRKGGTNLTLTIRDIRTGRDTPVEVNLGGPAAEAANPAPAPVDPKLPTGAGTKLGAVTEVVFYDSEAAVKVTEVEPGSPAARAGLEPGNVIIEADGTPILHPNTLNEVTGKSGPVLKLIVVDPRKNVKTPVEVRMR